MTWRTLWWRLRQINMSLHFCPFVWAWPDVSAKRSVSDALAPRFIYSASARGGPFHFIAWGYW